MNSIYHRLSSYKPSKKSWGYIVLILIGIWAAFRFYAYGDPSASIAGNDTATFIEGSQVPLFSAEIMTGRRLLTTNLLYKAFEPENGYQILVNGSQETTRRIIQPGFEGISILQNFFSILGWSALAASIALQVKSLFAKIASALIIPAFGFTPQIADWDSILMSESLTFSLFVLQLAVLIHIVFSLHKDPKAKITPWLVAWGLIYFFWANLRDTNNYATLVLIGFTGLTLLSQKFKFNRTLIGVVVFGMLLFTLGITTFKASDRSLLSTINVYIGDIFPHPARVEFMKEALGMPEPRTPEFNEWFKDNGVTAITSFFVSHPGYVSEKLFRDFPYAFDQGVQAYFVIPEKKPVRTGLIMLGESLHTETSTPFTLGLLLLLGIFIAALNKTNEIAYPWVWICAFVFMVATIAIIPTILGDTWALHRHTIFSIAMYRLSMWMFSIILIDFSLQQSKSGIG